MLRSRLLTVLVAMVVAPVLASPVWAEFEEGVHYQRLPVAVDTRNPQKVEVIEVFSYACIHCRNFQREIEQWHAAAPDHVDFHRMPATFNEQWAALAQAFYTAEALGVTDKVHAAIFSAIHDRGKNVVDPALMAEVFEQSAGVSSEQFNQVYRSFSVRGRVQQADARGRAYRLTGTPSMIVDGMYRVDARMAGNASMTEVVDYLVAERRAAAAAAAAGDAADGAARLAGASLAGAR
ncbi:MAG: thiol:disulfide interchange protein DsbA/DsbL [Pseudomonadales bacterium]